MDWGRLAVSGIFYSGAGSAVAGSCAGLKEHSATQFSVDKV
jgi:hypothetical protein